ncbi:extracellular matrix protein 3-like [Physella acuta]|uniref:extracellular matrix protein 3-like n=1 Tax=Physella acuta TaxID=109671 RepID=UPI0027DDA795|nr:extracellular matrix protein 3-like [Physella acuta]
MLRAVSNTLCACVCVHFLVLTVSGFTPDTSFNITNRGLTAPVGRSTYVRTSDLDIHVTASDPCTVAVLDSDPLIPRPGRLTPSKFPCRFGPKEVTYTHFGVRLPSYDVIRLHVVRGSPNQPAIIPVALHVKVAPTPLEVVSKNTPLRVEKRSSVSTLLDKSSLEFTYDRNQDQCRLSLLPLTSGLPRYGLVSNDSSSLQMVDCEEFLNKGIQYFHNGGDDFPSKDYIPFLVQIYNRDGQRLRQEYFHKLVVIAAGTENRKPFISSSSKLTMEVSQLVLTPLKPDVLTAGDDETPTDLLTFSLVNSSATDDGYFISTDDPQQKLTWFNQRDVQELKIAFIPPTMNLPKEYRVEMRVIDADGEASAPFILTITIRLLGLNFPTILLNRGLKVFEGKDAALSSETNLRISKTPSSNVKIWVFSGVNHGRLIIPDGRRYFTADDLDAGAVSYKHDDSDAYSDNVILGLTDGSNSFQFLFPIWISPKDDESPILNINVGLEVYENPLVKITPSILSASDTDSDSSQVKFILKEPFSQDGVIMKRQFQAPEFPEDWQLNNGFYEQTVEEFTQSDIINGLIFYKLEAPRSSKMSTDVMRFYLLDGGEPPNRSEVKQLTVKVHPFDTVPPHLANEVELNMVVSQTGEVKLGRRYLNYEKNSGYNPRDIKYVITKQVFDTDENTALETGYIRLCGESQSLRTFTQKQVNEDQICYLSPALEHRLISRTLQFVFDVEDKNGNSQKDQIFIIFLDAIEFHRFKIRNKGLTVGEGETVALTLDTINVPSDVDVKFYLEKYAQHGLVRYGNNKMKKGDYFTRSHIKEGRVTYQNQNGKHGDDEFTLDVTDGIYHIQTTVKVKVKNAAPKKSVPVSLKSGLSEVILEVPEKGSVSLNKIQIARGSENPSNVTFKLELHPTEGEIIQSGKKIREFTLGNLISGTVVYQHVGGEIGFSEKVDVFQLTVLDFEKTTIFNKNAAKVSVKVRILPVDNIPPVVSLGIPFEVSEGQKAAILPRHLDATDQDTEDGDILCFIERQPENGYLEIDAASHEKSTRGIPVSSFTIANLRAGQVNFVQSLHRKREPVDDAFSLSCCDAVSCSPTTVFAVTIRPANDEAPEISLGQFLVIEGGNMRIDLPSLKVTDLDLPLDQHTFVIIEPPKHGKVVRQTRGGSFKIDSFTLDDISGDSTIGYDHDDSDTTEDSFTFCLTDGVHNLTKTVHIKIMSLDDEAPKLVVNAGLKISPGRAKKITNTVLKAVDQDSRKDTILFYIKQEPKYGYLRKVDDNVVTNLTQDQSFTQRDIDKQKIEYVHTDLEGVRDLIKFDITDQLNYLNDRNFYVEVDSIEATLPKVHSAKLDVYQSGEVVLSPENLGAGEIIGESLTFIIKRAPSRGHLESVSTPGLPVSRFTDSQLNARRIQYVYTGEEEMVVDGFELEVNDSTNRIIAVVQVSVSDVENGKPLVISQSLHIKQGGVKVITPLELRIEDRDTDPSNVIVTITTPPSRGVLLHTLSRDVTSFTAADLTNKHISYQHDGSESSNDSFSFTVSDGTHPDFYAYPEAEPTVNPQTVTIQIFPNINQFHIVKVNKGASYLTRLEGDHLGFRFSSRILSIKEDEYVNDKIHYSLTSPPKHGYIINRAYGGNDITTWTQGDINLQQIEYILRPGANVTNDTFFFTISDKDGHVLASQPFYLSWAWISLENNTFVVSEIDQYLNVTLRRRGNMEETSYVTIQVVDGSAKSGEDFISKYAKQVQFSPGQREKVWRLRINDDSMFENMETFELRLSDPVAAVLELPDVAQVTIVDEEDESQIFFVDREYRVSEDIGVILLPIKRIADSRQESTVICYTVQGTAQGQFPITPFSNSDFVPRPADDTSIIRVGRDEKESFCEITIINDNNNEGEEQFTAVLSDPTGTKLGRNSVITIIIEPDKQDLPKIFLASKEYEVDESGHFVEVKVRRAGTDLSMSSSVTVKTRKSDPQSAEAGIDYFALNKVLEFGPNVTERTVTVTIVDDSEQPSIEGPERFIVQLRSPVNALLVDPTTAMVTIDDAISDLPSVQFKQSSYQVRENEGEVRASVLRTGDITHESTVVCYTQQGTARAGDDYVERVEDIDSVLVFQKGESEKDCRVRLINDAVLEDTKSFRLILAAAESRSLGAAIVGRQNSTVVTILDEDDYPLIKLAERRFSVKEPMFKGEVNYLKIPVIRKGDVSQTAIVTINSKDVTATSGKDYMGFFQELVFKTNMTRIEVDVAIFHNEEKEYSEMFQVILKAGSGLVKLENVEATVTIEERTKVADVQFPAPPVVMSLADYDRPELAQNNPVPGYPLICVTACNPKHPSYSKTSSRCFTDGVNDKLTTFSWSVAPPAVNVDSTNQLQVVQSRTFFTSPRSITLDSIYFTAGSQVECVTTAVNREGDPGSSVTSEAVTISQEKGICQHKSGKILGPQPFTARLNYTGQDDPKNGKKIKLTVILPHHDGMFPVYSTNKLTDLIEMVASSEHTQHKCSNLNSLKEDLTKANDHSQSRFPYQYDATLRSKSTVQFYRYLDLHSCMWVYESYFNLEELVRDCGAVLSWDEQIASSKQSLVTAQLPLHVSYVNLDPADENKSTHFDLTSKLTLVYTFDTPFNWQNGTKSFSTLSNLEGILYPTSIKITDERQLTVTFLTEAKFKVQFVTSVFAFDNDNRAVSIENTDLTFHLQPMNSDLPFMRAYQEWNFTTDISNYMDFSGNYIIELIPCFEVIEHKFSQSNRCSLQETVSFLLPIRLHQVSHLVPTEYSHNTQFHLTNSKEKWASDPNMAVSEDIDAGFLPYDKIYGRVSLDPVIDQDKYYDLQLDQVYLCTGKDGYIPKYDKSTENLGCQVKTPNLLYSFKLLDNEASDETNIPFKALWASTDPGAGQLVKQTGTDGFSFDALKIFQIDPERLWFIQVSFTIHLHNSSKKLKRDTELDSESFSFYSNQEELVNERDYTSEQEGEELSGFVKGVNMIHVKLKYQNTTDIDAQRDASVLNESDIPLLPIIIAVIALIVVICILAIVLFIRQRRKASSPPPSPTSTITIIKNGHSLIITPQHYNKVNADV